MTVQSRSGLTKWFAVLVIAVIAFFSAPSAMAQDAKDGQQQGALGRAQDKCMDIGDSRSILDQLVKDGAISKEQRDEAAGSFGFDEKKVDEIRKVNAERWDEIAKHHEESRGFVGKAGRIGQGIGCWAVSPANAAIEAVNNSPFWDDPIGKFAKSVMEGNTEAIRSTMTLWVDYSAENVDVEANTQGVKNIIMGLSGFALMASFIIGGWRIASARRGGLQEGFSELNENMIRWLVFSIAVPAMFPGALIASDLLAAAIMDQFGSPENLINLGGLENTEFGPVVTLALSGIMFVGSMVQILALITRVLLAPIAAGMTPLFAALSFSDTGRQGLNHLVAFLIAAIAFKPVSALLYAVVLWNVSGGGDIGAVSGLINALMLGIAGFSAPALVRALVPAVSQAGGGGVAPMLAGATGVVGGAASMIGSGIARDGAGLSAVGKAQSAAGTGAHAAAGGTGAGGMSAAGSGAPGPAGPRGGTGASRPSAGPSGSTGPSGASASRPASPTAGQGARSRPFAGAARKAARGAGAALQGTGTAVSAMGDGVRRAGNAGYRVQQLFDDSIGVPGGYAGQAHR